MPGVEYDADIGSADVLEDAQRFRHGRNQRAGVLADCFKPERDADLASRVGGGLQALDDRAAIHNGVVAGRPESTMTPTGLKAASLRIDAQSSLRRESGSLGSRK